MRRSLLIGLLTLGVIGGFGSGLWRLAHHRGASCDRAAWAARDDGDKRPPCRGERPDAPAPHGQAADP